MDPTGFRGSGSANEALKEFVREGMMMGSSSSDSSSEEASQVERDGRSLLLLLLGRLWVMLLCPIMVVSALARPRASMVNRTGAR